MKDKGRRLETEWEGLYKLIQITKSGVSVIIAHLCTGLKKGRYVVNDIKLYITRGQESGSDEYKLVALVIEDGI